MSNIEIATYQADKLVGKAKIVVIEGIAYYWRKKYDEEGNITPLLFKMTVEQIDQAIEAGDKALTAFQEKTAAEAAGLAALKADITAALV